VGGDGFVLCVSACVYVCVCVRQRVCVFRWKSDTARACLQMLVSLPVPQDGRMSPSRRDPTNRRNKSFHCLRDRKSHSAQFVFLRSSACVCVCVCVCAYVCAYARTCHPFYYLEL